MTDRRYVAVWCVNGWGPNEEDPTYESRICATLKDAQTVAAAKGESFGWAQVHEEYALRMRDELSAFTRWTRNRSWTFEQDGWIDSD